MPDDAMTTDPATEKLDSGKSHARQAAEDLKSAAEAKAAQLRAAAEAKAAELRQRAEQKYDEVRSRADKMRHEGEDYVRENPSRAVLIALGVGFVLGLIFRR